MINRNALGRLTNACILFIFILFIQSLSAAEECDLLDLKKNNRLDKCINFQEESNITFLRCTTKSGACTINRKECVTPKKSSDCYYGIFQDENQIFCQSREIFEYQRFLQGKGRSNTKNKTFLEKYKGKHEQFCRDLLSDSFSPEECYQFGLLMKIPLLKCVTIAGTCTGSKKYCVTPKNEGNCYFGISEDDDEGEEGESKKIKFCTSLELDEINSILTLSQILILVAFFSCLGCCCCLGPIGDLIKFIKER